MDRDETRSPLPGLHITLVQKLSTVVSSSPKLLYLLPRKKAYFRMWFNLFLLKLHRLKPCFFQLASFMDLNKFIFSSLAELEGKGKIIHPLCWLWLNNSLEHLFSKPLHVYYRPFFVIFFI